MIKKLTLTAVLVLAEPIIAIWNKRKISALKNDIAALWQFEDDDKLAFKMVLKSIFSRFKRKNIIERFD